MTKYLPYPRREFRRRHQRWIRSNARVVLSLTVGALVLGVVVTLLLRLGRESSFTWYFLGALHTALLASYLYMLFATFIAHDKEAIWHLRGAWGEENTRDELRRARRKHLIWGWVDSIQLQTGDLDHLVISRNGGLVALDSKWRSNPEVGDAADMARAAAKVKLRAEGLAQTVLKGERGARHRSRTNSLTVRPAVVVWGGLQHAIPPDAQIDGIEFVAGRRLHVWLGNLKGEPVTKEAAADLLKRLNDYRAGSWDSPRRTGR